MKIQEYKEATIKLNEFISWSKKARGHKPFDVIKFVKDVCESIIIFQRLKARRELRNNNNPC